MVGREAGCHGWHHCHCTVFRPWLLDDATETHQRHLGRVDDPEHLFRALIPEIGNGDGRLGQLGTPEGTSATAFDQVGQFLHQLCNWLAVGMQQRWRHQAALAEGYRDPDVHGCGAERTVAEESI